MQAVYTKNEFIYINSESNYDGFNHHIQGEIKHRIKHNKHTISFLIFKRLNLTKKGSIF
ncbi:hypothetical protein BSPLISOX_601 [uncultured Gammaproteobacteria bacterium]|nr:hypothetical protein [uncultured Gammaproteobacteria bacterium]CAC9469368.1 hypothetical protein [uncultured Gammaproteobacteria bacterium]VVH66177.1 hypothetical protein BSPLISOX_601 [uncultured Gammaproteobacteria bacterium]